MWFFSNTVLKHSHVTMGHYKWPEMWASCWVPTCLDMTACERGPALLSHKATGCGRGLQIWNVATECQIPKRLEAQLLLLLMVLFYHLTCYLLRQKFNTSIIQLDSLGRFCLYESGRILSSSICAFFTLSESVLTRNACISSEEWSSSNIWYQEW